MALSTGSTYFDPASARSAFYGTDQDGVAADWSIDVLAVTLAELGMINLFVGPGPDPTSISGYNLSYLWLDRSSGVTSAPGTLRKYQGTGTVSDSVNWPVVDQAALIQHLGGVSALAAMGSIGKATLAELNADLAHDADTLAMVYADGATNSGIYRKIGASGTGSWTRITDLPFQILPITITGGTADAIVATTVHPVPQVDQAALLVLTPNANNTGPVTLDLNGDLRNLLDAGGTALTANALIAGLNLYVMQYAGAYRLTTAGDLLAAVASASASATAAAASEAAAATSATNAATSATNAANSATAAATSATNAANSATAAATSETNAAASEAAAATSATNAATSATAASTSATNAATSATNAATSATAAAASQTAAATSETNAAASATAAAAAAAGISIASAINRTALKAINTTQYNTAVLYEAGREGTFSWKAGDYSTQVGWDTTEGMFIKANDRAATAGAWVRAAGPEINVKWFGAVGDGTTNDTVAMQRAFVAWYETGPSSSLYIPPGRYLVRDELTAGFTSSGKTVAKHILDGNLNVAGNAEFALAVRGVYLQSWIVVDDSFVSTDSNFIDSVVLRFELPNKQEVGPQINGVGFYSNLSYANRKRCPVGIKIINGNFSHLENLVFKGSDITFDWQGGGIHIESINNARFENWRIKAGYQPLMATMRGGTNAKFNVTTTTRIVDGAGEGAFTNPTGEADSWWNSRFLLLGKGAGLASDHMLVKTKSSGAKVNANTLDLDPAWPAQQTVNGINISFGMVLGSMTAGSNVLNVASPVLDSYDEGRMIHVIGAGISGSTERGIMSAYIKPGSIAGSGKSCQLVHSDGVTAANASTSVGNVNVVFSPPIYVGMSAEYVASTGHNNDIVMSAIHSEGGRGGCQMLFERILSCNLVGGKSHGRFMSTTTANQDVQECGYGLLFDSCKNMQLDNILITHPNVVDHNQELVLPCAIYGDRNLIQVSNAEYYGTPSHGRIWYLKGITGGQDIALIHGNGFNNTENWSSVNNDLELFHFVAGYDNDNIFVQGELKERSTGTAYGHENLLDPYRMTTFTPSLSFGGTEITSLGGSYSSRTGRAIKKGRDVWIYINIILSAKGTATGTATINIPPEIEPSNYNTYIGCSVYNSMASMNGAPWGSAQAGGDDFIQLRQPGAGGTGYIAVTHSNFTNSTHVAMSGSYERLT